MFSVIFSKVDLSLLNHYTYDAWLNSDFFQQKMTIFILRQIIKVPDGSCFLKSVNRWQYSLINHLVCELDGFGGLKFLEKTGQCVYSPDIKGYFMDHCRSEAGVYVDPLLIEGKKKDYWLYSTN